MNGIETPEVYKNHNVAPEVPKHLCDHSESQIVHLSMQMYILSLKLKSSSYLSVLANGLVNLSLYL